MGNPWHRPYQAYLFDLDGTLIDTAPDIDASLNHCLSKHGYQTVDINLTRHWVGHGVRALVRESLIYHNRSAPEEAHLEEMVTTFLDYYRDHLTDLSQPYPHVLTTLDMLKDQGAKLAVVTNKLTELSVPLIAGLDMSHYFESIICGDSAAHPKPNPDPIYLCLEELKVSANQALFVGDSETDVSAARAADMKVVCVRDGYNHGVDVTTLDLDGVIDSFTELLPTESL